MSETSGPAARRNSRANWVALRTLRQVPKVVGQTATGDPIFEVRSVRLVLRDDAAHFNRLVACSKCRRDVVGSSVLSAGDLDHTPQSVICQQCVRQATLPVFDPPVTAAARASATRATATEPSPPLVDRPPPGDTRLEALDRRLTELAKLMGTGANEAAEAALAGRLGETQAELLRVAGGIGALVTRQTDGERALRDLAERLDRTSDLDGRLRALEASAELAPAGLDGQDAGRREDVDQLSQRLEELGRRLDLLAERQPTEAADGPAPLDAVLEDLGRVEGAGTAALDRVSAELARIEEQANERLDRRAERARRADESARLRVAALEEAVVELAETLRRQRLALEADLAAGLAEARAAIAAATAGTAETTAGIRMALEGDLAAGLAEARAAIAAATAGTAETAAGIRLALEADLTAGLAEARAAIAAAAAGTAETTAGIRLALEADLAAGLAEARAAIAANAETAAGIRLALEADLAAARAAIAAATAGSAEAGADVDRRLDALAARQADDASAAAASLDALVDRLERLEVAVEAGPDRLEEQLDRRAKRAAEADRDRLLALKVQVEEAIAQLGETMERNRLGLEATVDEGLAAARTAFTVTGSATETRLRALEKKAEAGESELVELADLHAALDTGLGTLRTEIAAVRQATRDLAGGQDTMEARVEAFVDEQRAVVLDPARGRRLGGKSAAAANAQMAAASAALESLLADHRQLRDELVRLDRATATATDAAARATSQASVLAPLRRDVRDLREQVASQNEAIAALAATVERLARAKPATAAKAPAPARAPVKRASWAPKT